MLLFLMSIRVMSFSRLFHLVLHIYSHSCILFKRSDTYINALIRYFFFSFPNFRFNFHLSTHFIVFSSFFLARNVLAYFPHVLHILYTYTQRYTNKLKICILNLFSIQKHISLYFHFCVTFLKNLTHELFPIFHIILCITF